MILQLAAVRQLKKHLTLFWLGFRRYEVLAKVRSFALWDVDYKARREIFDYHVVARL